MGPYRLRRIMIACLLMITMATRTALVVDAHLPTGGEKEEEKKEDDCIKKEEECWKKSFGDMEIPPPISCSLTPPNPDFTFLLNVLVESNISKKFPSEVNPDLTPEDRFKIFELVAEAVSSYKKSITINKKITIEQQGVLESVSILTEMAASLKARGVKSPSSSPSSDDETLPSQLKKHILDTKTNLLPPFQTISTILTTQRKRIATPMSTLLSIVKSSGPPELFNDIHDPATESLFFEAQHLRPGSQLSLHFAKSVNLAPFLAFPEAKRSSVINAALLFDLFLIASSGESSKTSVNAAMDTTKLCDQPATKGNNRDKTCATDLESMLNYTNSEIGKDIRPTSTWLSDEKTMLGEKQYKISKILKLKAVHSVGCAKMNCPLALYFCQALPKMVAYSIELDVEGGGKVKAPAICHEDTSSWNPKSWIFKKMESKPGECKVCHFLAADDLAWMPKTQEDTVS